ncbi:MAG: DNA polymerase III subunit gamma/tau [Proteobacteria bacterium]|nr:DNA polymerase III subunit gamma/tau [Pseudomonadota bacterium]
MCPVFHLISSGQNQGSQPAHMTDAPEQTPYRVLARKYRPGDFAGLIGQEALVRTLTNAISSGRIAHAFMLTGVRGIGKTTTARIIARALNCIGPDGKGGPTIEPCGQCDHCLSIAEDRHVDVMEVDAASHTGVDNIRELTDGARYLPVSARYKIYIIDEIHMLSKGAFNALLKTLEEPPEHVKFIFATTEIRKVPVTVLSRCQRFDLRRVPGDRLVEHFRAIAEQEKVPVEDEALAIVARAADGSVRDGLSLLDQAMALGDGGVTAVQVRDMLGLADRTQIFDLFGKVISGNIADALGQFAQMYQDGADPVVVIQDLMELTHWLTRVSAAPEAAESAAVAEAEREQGRALAGELSIPVLTRAWQVLMKGLSEVQAAPAPVQAAEMVLVRLAYMAELPSPADLARELHKGGSQGAETSAPAAPAAPQSAPSSHGNGGNGGAARASAGGGPAVVARSEPTPEPAPEPAPAPDAPPDPAPAPQTSADAPPGPTGFTELVALFEQKREAILHTQLRHNVHLVRCEPGRLEIRPDENAPRDLSARVGTMLSEWTGQRWVVTVSGEQGEPTLASQAEATRQKEHEAAAQHPLVQAARKAFPNAKITRVEPSPRAGLEADAPAPAPDDDGDDGDVGDE